MTDDRGVVTPIDDLDEAESTFDRQLGEPDFTDVPSNKTEAPAKEPISMDTIVREETNAAIKAAKRTAHDDSTPLGVARGAAIDAVRRISERVDEAMKADGGRGRRKSVIDPPTPWTAAQCAARLMPLGKILLDGVKETDYVAIVSYSDKSGLYELLDVDGLAVSFNATANGSWRRDFECNLRVACKQLHRETDDDLIPVNNGIVRYSTGKFMPFSPDHVFLGKSPANWTDPSTPPPEPVLGGIANSGQSKNILAGSVFDNFSKDPDVRRFLKDICVMALRPRKKWGIAPVLFGEGSTGKSTFMRWLADLVGKTNSTSAQLSTMTTRFGLMHLIDKTLAVSDDESGTYIDDSGQLKSLVSGDTVYMDRKNKKQIGCQLHCMVIVGTNSYPKFKDKSSGIWRRFPVVPFDNIVRPEDRVPNLGQLLAQQEVRDWFLYHLLYEHPKVTGVVLPDAVKKANAEFREAIDPVSAFWSEYRDAFTRDFLPLPMLWAAFKVWYVREFGSLGKIKNARSFYIQLHSVLLREMGDPEISDRLKWVETSGKVSVLAWTVDTEDAIADLASEERYNKPRNNQMIVSPSSGQISFWLSPNDALWQPIRCRGLIRKSFFDEYEDPNSPKHGKTPRALNGGRSRYPSNGRG
ncbi:hypothetical protein GFD17_02680 [Bifidobacterium sp. SMB2]|uniref:SF3 helicase domain-containing protein n=1 Tax=Bifidobacterium saimiriisciurei TaxID=2661627 RepID=A0ABX0CFH4_9BIFI|nr:MULTISPECIES: phage/plasmid primase, P4 family [Bifidobacterium]NEG95675.1 hypothetical protein [Bifidobacterium sp. SMB2]NEH11102.1 hypothetical protein [Bifidobacterium saimiriisciurei]